MRKRLVFLFIAISNMVSAQLLIDGRQAIYDSLTNCFLATIAENCFNNNTTLSVTTNEGWQLLTIDGQKTGPLHTFQSLNAEAKYTVSLLNNDKDTLTGTIMFTFLPIVQLKGTFGYDYANGTFQLIEPQTASGNELSAQIKWRGGSTNTEGKHKRNYKIKFDTDHSFFGLRNDNNWILDAGQADVFRLRNRIAMDIWNDMARKPYYADKEPSVRNGVRGKVVELFLNNEYRGIYNFSENLDRKQMKLKKADKQTGEIHGCLYKVKGYGYGNMNDTVTIMYDNHSEMWTNIEVKYPDLQDADTTDWSTLYHALHFVTFSTDDEFADSVSDYFDIPLITDCSVFIAVVNALDNRGKNVFWAVYDKAQDKKLTPALWDLDCSMGQEWVSEDIRGPEILFDWQLGLTKRLSKNNVLHFNDSLNHRYQTLRKDFFTTDSLISRYQYYYRMVKKSGAAQREEAKWSGDTDVRGMTIDFDQEIEYISKWITTHMEWLDGAWFPLDEWYDLYEAGIGDITLQQQSSVREGTYTLGGQRIPDTHNLRPGIYIRNGKKIIIR